MSAEEFRPGNELTLFCNGNSLPHPTETEQLEESTGEKRFEDVILFAGTFVTPQCDFQGRLPVTQTAVIL